MQSFEIPGLTRGPGSQPVEPDGAELAYLSLPKTMGTYVPPALPEAEDAQSCPDGVRLLERLLVQLESYRVLEPSRVVDLMALPEPDRTLVAQALGEGEVSIRFSGGALRVQETRLAGLWHVQASDGQGRVVRDEIEVAEIPTAVRDDAFKGAARSLDPATPPEEVLTARSVLAELNERAASWRLGDLPHVVNLTLLPHSEADLAYLDAQLGQGPVTILSRGYGNCRVSATGLLNCWWVQHFNSDDKLILNTLEVVDVPAAALAAQEDIEDSSGRLSEILEAVR
ncbi:hydrogenase expression/formation protein [Imhoffiella purpurea]|uniref:Hydrogenase maturation factor HoxQ n=1 Tax=Imhoffiella purpurea TaxID=1249627 RepID=W9V745_9GAMM|nr:hydrogenase expression/formation protein [Imhoffiella purpurea]EXJ15234.1 Hydrogenase maturation factor HoxQ [Imhoffiella purpurea]